MGRLAEVIGSASTVVWVVYDQDVKYPAAALAYYAFVSFVPLLMLLFALVGEQLAVRVHSTTPEFLTPGARQLVYEAMTTATGRTWAALLAIGVLAWGGANVAIGFLTVVKRIEETPERPLESQVRDAVVVLGSIGLAIVGIVGTSALFSLPPIGPFAGLVGFVVLFLALTVAFLPLYYVPSRSATTPSAALPGALVTAFGWTLIHTGVHYYAANAGRYAIYGVLSGIIIILTSLYFAAVLLMVGIVVNATLETSGASRLGP